MATDYCRKYRRGAGTSVPTLPYPLDNYKGSEKRTCADCPHAILSGEVQDQRKPIEARVGRPLAYNFYCQHPDELFRDSKNTDRLGENPFPCDGWKDEETAYR